MREQLQVIDCVEGTQTFHEYYHMLSLAGWTSNSCTQNEGRGVPLCVSSIIRYLKNITTSTICDVVGMSWWLVKPADIARWVYIFKLKVIAELDKITKAKKLLQDFLWMIHCIRKMIIIYIIYVLLYFYCVVTLYIFHIGLIFKFNH